MVYLSSKRRYYSVGLTQAERYRTIMYHSEMYMTSYRVVRQWWIVRKPLETSGNRPRRFNFPNFISLIYFSKNLINRKIWKHAGNLRGRFPEVSGQSIIDGPPGSPVITEIYKRTGKIELIQIFLFTLDWNEIPVFI